MAPLIKFIDYLLVLYTYVVFAAVLFSWLIGFHVINAYNPFVRSMWRALNALTEPLLRPIRQFLPDLGGLDVSPIILLLAIYFVRWIVLCEWILMRALGSACG